ncbi:MAG: PQQ-like beta-propeller repeat protein [Planctomycetes bacterium]|nr:PQQ-like beta-propeller repeat protein [Planctomycetota bacterium]
MKPRAWIAALAGIALVVVLAADARGENWPRFRGPTGLGYTQEKNLPVVWGGPENKNVLWKAPLTGEGHASPIVWGDAVFVCTVFWPPTVTDRAKVIPEHHVACYGAADGKLLWDTVVPPGPWVRDDFRSGPGGGYAAATPATDGTRVYVAFASSVLAAIDMQGKIVWRKEIVPYTFDVTVASSPVVYGKTVILLCAMAKKSDSRVVAFDAATGEPAWETKLPDTGFGHSTPLVITVGGKPQMLILASGGSPSASALQSLDPATGKRLWWCRGEGDVASPAYGDGLVYFDSGRSGGGVAVDPTGSGDVGKTHVRWTLDHVLEGLGSPTVVGKYLYRLHSHDTLKCWEMATGKPVYSEKLKDVSSVWASPVVDPAGRMFFANAGKSYVVQAGPEMRVLAVNDLGDGNHPSPAVSGGRMLLVGKKNVYAIGHKD